MFFSKSNFVNTKLESVEVTTLSAPIELRSDNKTEESPAPGRSVELALSQNPVSIISLVNCIIEDAHVLRASDVHIDPNLESAQIRLRVDGVLQDFQTVPKQYMPEVISRIKILSGLRTDEHQASQDGRFRYSVGEVPVDVRVSIMPTYHGENVALRLLSDKAEEFTLTTLGFSIENQGKILHAISRPYGMILATGPTGSGKTTTLYTLIKILNTKAVSIITIEDPIEYAVNGINQIQVNPRTDLTFASGLRSVLRQDPNIIMVGEIRDQETAGIAVNTALTGHLLLSTLHTNDSATTLPRLIDLKIESYLIASTVSIAIGQRLVRKICVKCKVIKKITEKEQEALDTVLVPAGSPEKIFYRGAGCHACNYTGYFGRIGIHEVLVVDKVIREAILSKASSSRIKELAVQNGMIPMLQDGLAKAERGLTTIEEVFRMLYE